MKKLLIIIGLMAVIFLPQTSLAKDTKNSQGQEWVVVAQNKGGIYSYDKQSLVYFPDSAQPKDILEIKLTAKSELLDKNFKEQLLEKYGKKLKKDDNVQMCLLDMVLNKPNNTYKINRVELISTSGRLLVNKDLHGKFKPIPSKTFVAVLLGETIKILQPKTEGEQHVNTRFSENKKVSK